MEEKLKIGISRIRADSKTWVMKVISCKDMGASCEWVGDAETLDELRKKCAEHGVAEHGMQGIPDELWATALTLIWKRFSRLLWFSYIKKWSRYGY